MQLDNSGAKLFRFCPDAYKERYLIGIEKKLAFDAPNHLAFGTRIHTLLEEYYRTLKGEVVLPSEHPLDEVEREAQEMFAAYRAHYPVEPFSTVDVERTFKVEIAPGIEYTGKIDWTVRDENERLGITDHKSEKRGGKGNLPQAWAARDQVSLYKRAAEIIYKEPVHFVMVNVLTRSSPKGQEPPTFRRDILQRTEEQVQKAVDDLVYVAKQVQNCKADYGIETWPQNRENCHNGMWGCEYYSLHVFGRSEETLSQYQPTRPYLDL
jgi:hypothetical protein